MALDNEPAWHIFCGKPIYFIFNFPFRHCISGSLPWPDVLEPPAVIYGHITFQPIADRVSTLEADISIISNWMDGRPVETVGVIQTTWPFPSIWEAAFHEPNPDHFFTNYSVDYYYVLQDQLELENPGHRFVLTRSNEMLDYIRHDLTAPLDFLEMFRDAEGHMSAGPGRYLQHNAFRQAMRQETGVDSTADGLEPGIQAYLDAVIAMHPPF